MKKILIAILIIFAIAFFFSKTIKRNKTKNNLQQKPTVTNSYKNQNLPQNPGIYSMSIGFDGKMREYKLYIPPSYKDNKNTALVINLHGGGGSPDSQIKTSQMNSIADVYGFIVAYPKAINNHWNDSRKYAKEKSGNSNDVGFIRLIVEELTKNLSIDHGKIYATGISNGGMMAYRLACESSDMFPAIAPVSAPMPESLAKTCSPKNPVSIVAFQGTDDPIISYYGGKIKVAKDMVLSAKNTVQFWIRKNSCNKTAKIKTLKNIVPHDNTTVSVKSYSCPNKVKIDFYTIDGGGHTWPGGKRNLPEKLVGKIGRDINASQIIWDFFNSSY